MQIMKISKTFSKAGLQEWNTKLKVTLTINVVNQLQYKHCSKDQIGKTITLLRITTPEQQCNIQIQIYTFLITLQSTTLQL